MSIFIWRKKGLIFNPTERFEWMQCYSQVPTILKKDDLFRIYFTTRYKPENDPMFVSTTSFIDLKLDNPSEILYIHDKPVLELGALGTFDEFGIMPGCLVENDSEIFLYYTGWSRSVSVPYVTAIGVAVSRDGGTTFEKLGQGPLIGKSLKEPFVINGPYILIENSLWHMWYSSGISWIKADEKYDPVYVIKHAISKDGINWKRDGKGTIETVMENEAQNRPVVKKINGKYFMWYCFRKGIDFRQGSQNSYRLGMAVSEDLENWTRMDDEVGIKNSQTGWDSEMIAYPDIYIDQEKMHMFYNGNHFGKDGFGYAIADIPQNYLQIQ